MRDFRNYQPMALRVARHWIWDEIKRYSINTERGYQFSHIRAYYKAMNEQAGKAERYWL